MNDTVNQNLGRPLRYWYVDGLVEITGGFVILMVGLIQAVATFISNSPVRSWLVGQPLIIIGFAFLSRIIVRNLKERITYPRTGYVRYPTVISPLRRQRILLAFCLSFTISMIFGFTGHYIPFNYAPLAASVALALALTYLGTKMGIRRFYLISAATVFTGVIIFTLNLPDPWPYALIIGLEGIFWIISGVCVLIHYLRTTQPLD
jgi:hypothetical protein